jgi:hypothetical protein
MKIGFVAESVKRKDSKTIATPKIYVESACGRRVANLASRRPALGCDANGVLRIKRRHFKGS